MTRRNAQALRHDNLEQVDRYTTSFAFSGQREAIYHGLGVEVPPDLTPRQIQQAASLDWGVVRQPLYRQMGMEDDGVTPIMELTPQFALARDIDNRVLSYIPGSWNPVQNDEAFDFFNEVVEAGDMHMSTAGSLRNGEIVFAMAKVNDGFELPGGDRIDGYMLFSNPHTYGASVNIRFTPTRAINGSSLVVSLRGTQGNFVKANHRSLFDTKKVQRALAFHKDTMARYREQAFFLASKRYNDTDALNFFKEVFPAQGLKGEDDKLSLPGSRALALLDTYPGARLSHGTYWQLLNAALYYVDFESGRKPKDSSGVLSARDTRLQAAWFGQGAVIKANALAVAMRMAEPRLN
jgi:phage/plasmid-like protein (TIGR03299 family)